MAKLTIEDYTVDIDTMNAAVYYNYIGKDKEDNPKPAQKLVGYYNPNVMAGATQAFEAIIKHGISSQGEITIQELIDFSKANKQEIAKFIKGSFNKEV